MPSRRSFVASCGVIVGSALLPGLGRAETYRRIPQKASARVIVDNDFAGDPDGLVALAHQLLSPRTKTVLVTASALDPKLLGDVPAGTTAAAGRAVATELIRRAGIANAPPVVAGSELLGAVQPEASAAARAIVAEAMRDDPLPLYFTCGGPLTNLAAALRLEPKIAGRMTVIWIGGGAYPAGGWEYNLSADIAAAQIVIEQSKVPLWQIPQDAYRQMQFSVAELAEQLRPISPLGEWLYDRFTTPPSFVDVGGSWPLGDSPTVLLSAISQESSTHVDLPGRRIKADCTYGEEIAGRTLRVFRTLDARLTFGDFFALMRLHARR
ncbi:nucleoside hydrolase [Novosphingobium sp. ST904]|uniref:nucleoside hydrolase n=1 Tax=Novosphingobium sp. ST904 TaxID=1684385 RepID=UPI0010EBF998|nr:nucleoside hydrolase [Novosphingobium sp. ST904]TCM36096.1 inosine-uridine preferring nucleoside hydrolase [Novosphingobium sp. ST904]